MHSAILSRIIIPPQQNPEEMTNDWLDDNGQNDWEYWTTYIQDKNKIIWEATLNIANTANDQKILYDISPIKKVGQSIKLDTIPTDTTIPHSVSYVNREDEDVT